MGAKVSIIIPFYNCPFIQEAVKSALGQTYQNIEVIVVDDGSTKHQDLLNPYLSQIRYFKKSNGGTASALNDGIRNATGEYFCWLSSDDRFFPEKIEKQLAFMEQRNAAASYSAFTIISAQGKIISEPIGHTFRNKLSFLKRMRGGCPINGCTVMLKISVFAKLGYFDERLPFTHDYDFWLRLIQHYDFHFLPEPLTEYRHHGEMGTKKHFDRIRKEERMVKQRHAADLQALIKKEL
ncbi:glycosyltransferase [Bacillota bacterium Lsc_1132]